MKKVFIILCSCWIAGNVSAQITQEQETGIYVIELPEKGQTSAAIGMQTVSLKTFAKSHKLDFGSSSTVSTIEFFPDGGSAKPWITMNFKPNEQQLVDISTLDPGFYTVRITAIAESFSFPLQIR